jgi:hypothetical protein
MVFTKILSSSILILLMLFLSCSRNLFSSEFTVTVLASSGSFETLELVSLVLTACSVVEFAALLSPEIETLI